MLGYGIGSSIGQMTMDSLSLAALQVWCHASNEGLLVIDPAGLICFSNLRAGELLRVGMIPSTLDQLLRMVDMAGPEFGPLRAVRNHLTEAQWGTLQTEKYPPQRLIWQQIPLANSDTFAGSLVILRDATTEGQSELAKQSFLSMISHDLRTPLSAILGFAELLYNNRETLSKAEQTEFLEHVVKNANELSQYTQIALDIMYLEANMQHFDTERVHLDRLIRHWLADARHRLATDQIVYRDTVRGEPATRVSPAAMHRILFILMEFALTETLPQEVIDIHLSYEDSQAHLIVQLRAPDLRPEDAAQLFRLLHPRDLSEMGRPPLHRMQLYVANLLAERQQGYLTLRSMDEQLYELDLVVPLMAE